MLRVYSGLDVRTDRTLMVECTRLIQAPTVMCLSITLQFNRVVPVLAVPGPGQDEAISDQGLADTLAGFRGHAT